MASNGHTALGKREVLLGFVGGALTGGLLYAGFLALNIVSIGETDVASAVLLVVLAVLYASAVWAIGLVVIGGPIWFLLHRLGFRSVYAAVLTGLLLAFLGKVLQTALSDVLVLRTLGPWQDHGAQPIVIDGIRTAFGWKEELRKAALLALAGSVVGWVIWQIAYRRSVVG